jgi:DNA-binding CsgD family transcriptional regulator
LYLDPWGGFMSGSNDSQKEIKSLGFCVKTRDWTVQWQNDECLTVCGPCVGKVCQMHCRQWAQAPQPQSIEGAQLYRSKAINGVHYDLVVLETEDEIVSVLCPIEQRRQETTTFYQTAGLSPRETEIMLLKLEGLKNKDICTRLFISESTLKTHINNIRVKLKQQNSR